MSARILDESRSQRRCDGKQTHDFHDVPEIIPGLNHDLAGEYQGMLMYLHYSAKLTGPYRGELRALFQKKIVQALAHAQFLADKIVALGGEPSTEPAPVSPARDTRDILEQALAVQNQAVDNYEARVGQAEVFGDIGLRVALEHLVADETEHKEELERILAGWNEQNRERVRNEDRWQDDGGQG